MQDITNLRMFSLQDVADIMGLTYRTIFNYKKQGKFKTVKIGTRVYVTEEELKKFLAGNQE